MPWLQRASLQGYANTMLYGGRMKVRHIEKGWLGGSNSFNTHGIGEMIVYYEGGDASSEFCRDYEVWVVALEQWKPFGDAMKDGDIITDNHNSHFFEPQNTEDRKRGFTL